MLHFLWEESQSGVRSGRAKEVLATLKGVPEFAVIDEEQPWSAELAEAAEKLPAATAEAEPEAASGLPRASELKDPPDYREVFKQLRTWVQDKKLQGTLDDEGTRLGANYRACLFAFLVAFVARRTVFKSQAKDILERLAESPAWCQGGAFNPDAAPLPSGGLAQEEEEEETPGDFLGSTLASGPAPLPPSVEELQSPTAEVQDLLLQLCAWINTAQRSGTLAAEAAALEEEHRKAITTFLLADPAAPGPGRRRSLMSSLRQASSKALPKALVSKGTGGGTAEKQGAAADSSADRRYVLLALAELGDWFDAGGVADQSVVSRALARAEA